MAGLKLALQEIYYQHSMKYISPEEEVKGISEDIKRFAENKKAIFKRFVNNYTIIDMNQLKDFTNLKELKEKEEIEKQELLKQQIEVEIEKKQQELENLKNKLASAN